MLPEATLKVNWKEAIASRAYVIQLAITSVGLLILALLIGRFFAYVQSVQGASFNDPILEMIPADDVSVVIFTLIYGGVLSALIYLCRYPFLLLKAGQAYVLLTLMRIATLYFFPLEPDADMVPLRDPFVDNLFYRDQLITKDLFFSGHVSVIAMLAFVSRNFYVKRVLSTISLIVAISLLIQHVHYTIDVIAAPVFAWLSVEIVYRIPHSFPVRQPRTQ